MSNAAYNGDVSSVIQIIQRLHGSDGVPPGLDEQKQLQHALFTAQQPAEAWSLGGQLLSSDFSNTHVRFFGAHTLTVKIARDWTTLPEEHWSGLKEAMLGWLSDSARHAYPPNGMTSQAGERIVFRKLAVAVTSLSFRLVPLAWPNWLLETVLRLAASGCSRLGIYEFLTLAIEEIGRADLVGSKRVQYDQVVSDVAPTVSEMITKSLENPTSGDYSEANAALKCLQSWVSKRDINRNLLESMWPLVLQLLPNEATCSSASACIEDILLDSTFSTEKRVSPLLDFCASAEVGQIFSKAQAEEDVDELALPLFKLLVAVFEHSYTLIVTQLLTERSISLLQRLLLVTCFPGYNTLDESVSDLGLPIWAYLQEEIADNGIVATKSGLGDPRWPVVKEVFDALVRGLRTKLTLPSSEDFTKWPKDIKQSFSRYRVDVGDCLINAYYVLREGMLSDLISISHEDLHALSTQTGTPQALEASLYAIGAIHEAVPMDEETSASQLFSGPLLGSLPQYGTQDIRLQRTGLWLIEVYAPWFKHNKANLLQAVQYVVGLLDSPSTCQAAASALSNLCDACRNDLTDHVGSFAQLVSSLEGRIPEAEYVRVVGSVAAVVQALPAHRLVEPVVMLVQASINKLAQALTTQSDDSKAAVLLQLASLTACAKSLAEPEDEILDLDSLAEATDEADKAQIVNCHSQVELLRSHLLQAIEAITQSFLGDAEVSQALADFLKACTNTNLATPLSLDPLILLKILSTVISSNLDATWLSISSLLLFRLRKKNNSPTAMPSELREILSRVLEKGLQSIPDLHSMELHPDVVQTFMEWALSALTSFATTLSSLPQLLERLVLLAIRGLELQERVGLSKTIQLLTSITNEAATTQAHTDASAIYLALMQAYGRSALEKALAGVGGKLPRSSLGYLAELLLAFSKRLPNESRVWLKELCAQDGYPSKRVSQEQKDRYCKSIMSARSLRKLREATENFAIVCRGLEGTSYATG